MRILIVDDEPLVRRSLQRAFVSQGHQVDVAEDGLIGLKLWQERSFDVLFLDVLMPEMTGPQVLQAISPMRRSGTKVILMSAFTGASENQEAAGLADRFLAKPFEDIFAIVKMAEELMNGKC